MSNKIVLNQNASVGGTSFHSVYINVKPSDLFLFFGDSDITDDYKVSKEWTFQFKGMVFTIYDWKSTNLYDRDLPSPEDFWAQDEVRLHVGGWSFGDDIEFKEALEMHLFNKVGFLVLDA